MKNVGQIVLVGLVVSVMPSISEAQNAYSTVSGFAGKTHRGRFVIRENAHRTLVRGRWGGGVQPWVAQGFTQLGTTFLNNNVLFPTGLAGESGTATTSGEKTTLGKESGVKKESGSDLRFNSQFNQRASLLKDNQTLLNKLNKELGVKIAAATTGDKTSLAKSPDASVSDDSKKNLGSENKNTGDVGFGN